MSGNPEKEKEAADAHLRKLERAVGRRVVERVEARRTPSIGVDITGMTFEEKRKLAGMRVKWVAGLLTQDDVDDYGRAADVGRYGPPVPVRFV